METSITTTDKESNLPSPTTQVSLTTSGNMMVRFSQVRSAESSFALQVAIGEPTLFSLSKQCNGNAQVIVAIRTMLAGLNTFLKTDKPLSLDEIKFAADEIYERYKLNYTFADINVVIRKAMAGDYGKLYNKLAAADILQWFADYDKEKDAVIMNYRIKENKEQSKSFKPTAKKLPYHYEKDKDGRIICINDSPDTTAIAFKSHQKKESDEYKAFRDSERYNAIMAKDEADRTQKEKDWLYFYQINQNRK